MDVKKNNNGDLNKENETIQTYQWRFETEDSIFTGTCLSIDQVNKEISMLTENTKILKKSIVPVNLSKKNLVNNDYSWDVVVTKGHASSLYANLKKDKKEKRTFKTIEALKSALKIV